MKKVTLPLLVLFVLTFTLSSCSMKAEDVPADTSKASSSAASSVASGSTPEEQVQIDKGLLNVKITFPASLFEDSQSTLEETEAAAKEQGVEKVTFNNDGSVTFEMSKDTHKKLVDEIKKSVDATIDEILSDPDGTNSFESITYNDDCSEFNVMVDGSKYNEWESLVALGLYVQGIYYQTLQGVNPDSIKVIVNFIDKDSKEILNTADSSELTN